MPAANDDAYSVQKFLNGYAIVWWEDCGDGPKRRRLRLAATDRESAKAEARKRWEGGDDSPWTVGRCMTGYLASIEGKVSHQRRQDAWKAMKLFWADVDPSMIDKAMCQSYRAKRQVGDATARYELMQLSTALGWAFSARRIERKPAVWLPGWRKVERAALADGARPRIEVIWLNPAAEAARPHAQQDMFASEAAA